MTARIPSISDVIRRPCESCGRPRLASTLRQERINRQWSQHHLAAQLRRSANPQERRHLPALPVIQRMIRAWEAGDTTPGEVYERLYCRVFDMAYDDLFIVVFMEVLPGLDGPLLIAEPSPAGTA
ncbi:hypothetical protein J4573_00830 [Actinomadura barringtoniae]|uniref:Uncharacterized protein n=1 Tax=Actinomadura barringtoniae TaxID=1427535 RepID=A0A939PAD0_9ACTN|nr:hypothetical protein [Actinomadura barringtoniae]MBO2445624.1 hypothetical protein [Actinomadura barringtoniae]